METSPLQRRILASDIAPERLAGNPKLTQQEKIAEASRQFEAVLLRQILGDAQKTVIPSELSDNSTAAGIYQDLITKTLADSMSKGGGFGLARTFEQQLDRPANVHAKTGHISSAAALTAPTAATAAPPSKSHLANPRAGHHFAFSSASSHE